MRLLLLEAFGALILMVLIVWWTMFSGRKRGELPTASLDQVNPIIPPQAGAASSASADAKPPEAG